VSGYTIFVADTRHATVFELSQPSAPPRVLETLQNPFTARHDRDLGADAPGSVVMRAARGGGCEPPAAEVAQARDGRACKLDVVTRNTPSNSSRANLPNASLLPLETAIAADSYSSPHHGFSLKFAAICRNLPNSTSCEKSLAI